MGKKVVIETDECIGCESCVELCPEIFDFDQEAGKTDYPCSPVIKLQDSFISCSGIAHGLGAPLTHPHSMSPAASFENEFIPVHPYAE